MKTENKKKVQDALNWCKNHLNNGTLFVKLSNRLFKQFAQDDIMVCRFLQSFETGIDVIKDNTIPFNVAAVFDHSYNFIPSEFTIFLQGFNSCRKNGNERLVLLRDYIEDTNNDFHYVLDLSDEDFTNDAEIRFFSMCRFKEFEKTTQNAFIQFGDLKDKNKGE